MAKGKQVRIVKRAERLNTQAALSDESSTIARASGKEAKRDAVAVIRGWVRELRQKKVEETARGFESLFSKATLNTWS